jgi:anaerobic selenocysteine-containing dehydrogenase
MILSADKAEGEIMSVDSTQTTRNEGTARKYRDRWRWDRIGWASHCIDCYPGNCPMRVYVKDGIALREEQCGTMPAIEEGVPDMNPMGCQKSVAWASMHYSQERLLHPMKRDGERGSGKWKRITWDEALTEVADGVLDAIEEQGPESIIHVTYWPTEWQPCPAARATRVDIAPDGSPPIGLKS